MLKCAGCGAAMSVRAVALPFCAECLRKGSDEVLAAAARTHVRGREPFGLPQQPPRSDGGKRCGFCVQDCRMAEGERGYCGLRENQGGRLRHFAGTAKAGLLHYYHDPLPTNCVADWVCSGSQQRGFENLAVFYGGCTFNCLNCQNWHHRDLVEAMKPLVPAEELAAAVDGRTHCACFFGGDPSAQMPHALATARRLARRGVRVCWETNGSMNPRFLQSAVKLSLATGGIVKFDLKAFSSGTHRALTGADNRRTLENFVLACSWRRWREKPPLVVASTLLIPGVIDAKEVGLIAAFIAQQGKDIPYALLAFHPQFLLSDLPATSRKHAWEAQQAAREAGLENVRVGNLHLLGSAY
jgi:pyruvate formate lyase activating enzyme